MLKSIWLRPLWAALLGAALTLSGPQPGLARSTGTAAAISVSGGQFLRAGRPWVARGMNIAALISCDGRFMRKHVAAARAYGQAEYDLLRKWNVDAVRFQVSEACLAPSSPIHDPEYRNQILRYVADARRNGMAVILSMSSLRSSGLPGLPRWPSTLTFEAWQVLAPLFSTDHAVIYEAFNEPQANVLPRRRAWGKWLRTEQAALNVIRQSGACNVVLLDGLRASKYLQNMPVEQLQDPCHQLGFAVHPYPNNRPPQATDFSQADFAQNFGWAAGQFPVMVTEWYTGSQFDCFADDAARSSPQIAKAFLDYIAAKHIGLFGWTFDHLPNFVTAYWQDSPSFFPRNFSCDQTQPWGPGMMLRTYYTTGRVPDPYVRPAGR